jgi:hypothetical protein
VIFAKRWSIAIGLPESKESRRSDGGQAGRCGATTATPALAGRGLHIGGRILERTA